MRIAASSSATYPRPRDPRLADDRRRDGARASQVSFDEVFRSVSQAAIKRG